MIGSESNANSGGESSNMMQSKNNPVSLKGLEAFILILAALVGGTSIYIGVHYPSSTPVAQQTGPFKLTLMEIMDTGWNSTIAHPSSQ